MDKNIVHQKLYSSATQRLLKAQIEDFFNTQFPKFFGPIVREKIATALLELFDQQVHPTDHLKPGQMLWNAVDINTRADSPNRRFIPVILTMVDKADIDRRTQGRSIKEIRAHATARILREAYEQGALLSMRDITLLCWHTCSSPTIWRKHYEAIHECELPHPGNLQDMGSCITHKEPIVYKAIVEGKDPTQVSRETKHTQKAVDHYLEDYHKVQTLYRLKPNPDFISMVTGISKSVVNQYINLIETYELNT